MKIAHVREQDAPAGTRWRLAAALDADGTRWLDLEAARRSLVGAQPARAHNDQRTGWTTVRALELPGDRDKIRVNSVNC